MRDLFLGYQLGRTISESIKTNHRLAEIISGQNAQQFAQQQLSQQLDALLHFRSSLKQAAQIVDKSAVHTFWRMLAFQRWSQQSGVSSASFQQVQDKEVFHECQTLAEEIQRAAKQTLSGEKIEVLTKTSRAIAVAPSLRIYLVWNHIYERMRTCSRFPAFMIWNGRSTFIMIAMGLTIAPLGFASIADPILKMLRFPEWISVLVTLLILGLLPIFNTIAYYKRSKLAPRLNQLAQTVGGHITTRTRIKDLKGFVPDLKATLVQAGVPAERMNEGDLLAAYHKEAELIHASNEAYDLGIDLADYPLTIPLEP